MTNYVLLYTGGTYPESDEEMEAVMSDWGAWYGTLGDAVVDGGNPFGHAKSVTADGVQDNAVSNPPATGYTVISADSLDEAVALVKGHPHIKHGGEVTVHETFQM